MKYLTVAQLQEKFSGRSRTSLWRDVRDGRLPEPIRLGDKPYWRDCDVDAAMERLEAAQMAGE